MRYSFSFLVEVRDTTHRPLFTDDRFATEWDMSGDGPDEIHVRELTEEDE